MNTPVCLTIAGSDSGGEAGIQADLKTFSDFDCHGLSAITANTAQNPQKIMSLNPVSLNCLKEQLVALFSFFEVKFIKTGLLPNIDIMKEILKQIPDSAILICDPLIASTSGTKIMNEDSLGFFKKEFSSRIDYLTPNFPEAEFLLNSKFSNRDIPQLMNFARKGVFLKGGHSEKPGTDYFFDSKSCWELSAEEVEIKSSHGTGCRISSALCAALAKEKPPIEAAVLAKNYVYHTLNKCWKTSQNQWLMSSPGNIFSLENRVKVQKV
ncbi:MAG: hydroxymethylpyrimidine/phosphomethylpyrimidine kinase [Lentisphaeraceae bacterium]|nr:hydroxymethylpyrimidine/phosphomethylpyrimidine kinase [Lentisphaeraceae bacterium]